MNITRQTLVAAAALACLAPQAVVAQALAPAQTPAAAQDAFVVRDMRVDGLLRIDEGTVYNYLPVNIGDTLDGRRLAEALRAVYKTGFFEDVELRRDGDTLVIVVSERPSIASFNISGNKDIKTEDLIESLRGVGLAPGKSFDRSTLDSVEQFLTQQYFERGKYGVRIASSVEELEGNRVAISVAVTEGARARIRQINIVGNTSFDDETLLEEFKLRTPNLLSFYRKDDRYAREALAGDMETLASYYMDRGFADFLIDSTQVAISPDKQDMFITININEGNRYTISEVTLSGDLVLPESHLLGLVLAKPGQTFSRKLLTQTQDLINYRLGQEGYARARVDLIPDLDREAREVAINLRVDPGNRVYVRRIDFNGTSGVNDEVFRREMRQLEGAFLSNIWLERSEQRIRRLPYVEEVSFETRPVPGTDDMVDVDFDIKEGLPGQFGGGLGFSGTQGLLLNGNFTHTNFMGTGKRVAAEINAGRFSKVYSISHTNPYFNKHGKSLSLSLGYRDLTQFISGASDFSTETLNVSAEFGVPISEYARFSYGLGYQDVDLLTSQFSASQAQEFVRNNGNSFSVIDSNFGTEFFGSSFKAYELFAGWTRDSRDRVIFPTRGTRQRLVGSVTVPGSDVEYYTLRYDYSRILPIYGRWALAWSAELAYGEPIGDTTDLPPYKNFFAGGPDTVRGFENGHLGPRDSLDNPYGGNLLTVSQLELLLPMPEKFGNNTRFSLFYDVGNVFYTGDTEFCITQTIGSTCNFDIDGDGIIDAREVEYDFDADEFRSSFGVAVQWLAPLGTFRFSYAFPLNDDPLDQLERFQFSVGSAF